MAVIGASALAYQLPSYRRETNDLDLVVAISVEDSGRFGEIAGWQPLPQAGEQAWQSPEAVRIDIVPASRGLLDQGVLRWPRSGMEMSLVGLRLAFEARNCEQRPIDYRDHSEYLPSLIAFPSTSERAHS
jgi:hypothetical protein